MITVQGIGVNLSHGQTSSNSNFTTQHQEIEQKTFRPENKPQVNPRLVTGRNYQAVLGFGDIPEQSLFTVRISGTIIDYGKLYPTNPVLRENTIEIDGSSTHGYSILTSEDHPLADDSFSNLIPDTSCDRGLCSETTSATWSDNLTYGFGYACENLVGTSCFDFEPLAFKSFADLSKSENHQPATSSLDSSKTKIKLTYRVNISASQENKTYLNNLNYVVLPNL